MSFLKAKQAAFFWFPVVVWCGLIFYLSSLTAPPPSGNPFFDLVVPYLAHFSEYFILFSLLFRATRKAPLSFFWGMIYAFSDEFHQSFVSTRTPSWLDILADVIGLVLAWVLLKKFLPKLPAKIRDRAFG